MPAELGTLLVAGTHSGCGKTTVTLGIMAALKARGLTVQPFKCGPDFIDPTLHRMVTGRVSPNLDMRMCGSDYVKNLFANRAASGPDSINIIEGVMGLFDGREGSGATLAASLGIPVLLVVDISSAAESVAAVVHGFETLDPSVNVTLILLNRAGSSHHAEMVKRAVQEHCSTRVAGTLPRDPSISIASRHLGLEMGTENPLDREQIKKLAALIEKSVDLDLVISTASKAARPCASSVGVMQALREQAWGKQPVQIGVARDEAFCFYYEDNIDMLEAAGAETVEFSPLRDRRLPEGISGLYLGGGYPELHAGELSENRAMLEQTATFSGRGLPVFAECGGFMYLTRSITDLENRTFRMAGVYPFRSFMQKRLRRLGYRSPVLTANTILGRKGERLYGHEFHYSDISTGPDGVATAFELDDNRTEGYRQNNTLAGYIHLHWGRTPQAALNFVEACRSHIK